MRKGRKTFPKISFEFLPDLLSNYHHQAYFMFIEEESYIYIYRICLCNLKI